jgi:UDP-N-acetylmuramoyl-tripeptide--D-alanyl-D-alanine ligase
MSATPGAIPSRLAAPVPLDLADVLQATSGELAKLGAATAFRGVTTDSRTIEPGELFVAVRGETHDGHAFLQDALGRGAGGVVVESGTAVDHLDGTVIVVRETLAALGDLAAAHRRRHPVPLVAVAGSNGKTTKRCSRRSSAPRTARIASCGRAARRTTSSACRRPCCASTTRRASSCS